MGQIRGLTTEIVEKIRGGMGKEVQGRYLPLEVECPRCQASSFKETFRDLRVPGVQADRLEDDGWPRIRARRSHRSCSRRAASARWKASAPSSAAPFPQS